MTASSVTLVNHIRNLVILHILLCLPLNILSVLEYCFSPKHLFRPFCCSCLNPGHHHILSGEQVSNLVLLLLDSVLTIHPPYFCHTDFIFYYPAEKLLVSPIRSRQSSNSFTRHKRPSKVSFHLSNIIYLFCLPDKCLIFQGLVQVTLFYKPSSDHLSRKQITFSFVSPQ